MLNGDTVRKQKPSGERILVASSQETCSNGDRLVPSLDGDRVRISDLISKLKVSEDAFPWLRGDVG